MLFIVCQPSPDVKIGMNVPDHFRQRRRNKGNPNGHKNPSPE